MFAVIRSSWPLFFGMALIMLGNGLQGTLLGVRASLEGFSTGNTGLIMTGYYLGFLAGSFLIPRAIGNVGHIRVFAALASLASSSVLVHVIVIDVTAWTAMRVVTGFSYAGLYIVCESWINDRATNDTRGQLLSVYMLVVIGSMALGQGLLNVAEPGGPTLFILTSVLVSLALVPISLTVTSAPHMVTPERIGFATLYRTSPLGIVGIFGSGIAAGVLFGMGAVFATLSGLSIAKTAYFMATIMIGGFVFQGPIGWLSDRFDRRLIITGTAAACACSAVFGAFAGDGPLLFVAAALVGGFAIPLYSLSIAYTNDYLRPEQMVAASASLVMFNGIGASVGPVAVSAAMGYFGPSGFFWWLAAIHAVLAAFALYRMTRRRSAPLEDQGQFVPLPARGTPLVAAIAAEEAAAAAAGGDDGDAARPAQTGAAAVAAAPADMRQ